MMNKFSLTGVALLVTLSFLPPAMARERTRTFSSSSGRAFSSQSNRIRTGPGAFSNSGTYTRTGLNGQSRSGSFDTTDTRTRNADGSITTNGSGQITAGNGSIYNLNRNGTRTQTDAGYQRNGSSTITNSSGNVVGSRSSTSSYDNTTNTGTKESTITRNGQTRTIDSTLTKQEDGSFQKATTVTNSSGQVIGGSNTNAKYNYVPGQGWTKTVTGTTNSGNTINGTVTTGPSSSPNP
ncbi:hypothetical protein [Anthocerotibacter panamensis]|uniref:hypothetical protein n=1 Tax=Anthocerotibacter panamensis TaxID=2857077 RepID=UPI001C4088DB|nr:hypothetical protein [Anthocerotibacter panamensis]